MKHLLVVLTNNRVNEKIRYIVPKLSKHYKLSLYNIGEMSSKTKWYGDLDPRIKFHPQPRKILAIISESLCVLEIAHIGNLERLKKRATYKKRLCQEHSKTGTGPRTHPRNPSKLYVFQNS